MDSGDILVQDTDFDALTSRYSCYLKKYIPQDTCLESLIVYLLYYKLAMVESDMRRFALLRRFKKQFFNMLPANMKEISLLEDFNVQNINIPPYTTFKSPLINKGTFLRTSCINAKIKEFADLHTDTEFQIISLGSGNDTRPFYVIPEFPKCQYFELDFEDTIRLKKLSVLSSPKLSASVKLGKSLEFKDLPKTPAEIQKFDTTLSSKHYNLIPIDLRCLTVDKKLSDIHSLIQIDPKKPTLIISECCTCYLSKLDSDNVFKFWKNNIDQGRFIIYEPLGGPDGDSYGQMMVRNLKMRGIEMPTLMEYGTTEKQTTRFKEILGEKANIVCNNMNQIEKDGSFEVSSIVCEQIDELEEYHLINSHYCLVEADWINC